MLPREYMARLTGIIQQNNLAIERKELLLRKDHPLYVDIRVREATSRTIACLRMENRAFEELIRLERLRL